ncbi:MAG TPA: DUF1810 family protein [Vicinamibacterales bacterium]|nr:DUF1810 family protein [Vicinamibacterales bacterium]
MGRLDRFKSAQASPHSGFASALAEIRSGRKTGHWIWYVFPQLEGLGISGPSQMYAVAGEAEAAEFLRDSELRSRLLTILTAVAEQLRSGRVSLDALMGSTIDARKLVSSLTLFGHVAEKVAATDDLDDLHECESIARVAGEVLAIAAAEGYPACAYTLRHLGRAG